MNTQLKSLNRIIFILSIAGLIMGTYVLQSFLRQTGIVCLSGGGCEAVRKSILSYPFGVPVPAVGVAGYTFLMVLSFLRTFKNNKGLLWGIFGMTLFGICFVTWFTYTELFLIKGVCMWCAISAVNMYVIFGLTVKSLMLAKKI
ncbi:MAG: vitamin K epoxide reductase family protein [Candidatus Gottesmanbacteria bacterium]